MVTMPGTVGRAAAPPCQRRRRPCGEDTLPRSDAADREEHAVCGQVVHGKRGAFLEAQWLPACGMSCCCGDDDRARVAAETRRVHHAITELVTAHARADGIDQPGPFVAHHTRGLRRVRIHPLPRQDSAKFNPQARTPTRTWPGPGSGSGPCRTSSISGPPNFLIQMACISTRLSNSATFRCRRRGHESAAAISSTTLPRAWPDSTCASASRAASSGKLLSMMMRNTPAIDERPELGELRSVGPHEQVAVAHVGGERAQGCAGAWRERLPRQRSRRRHARAEQPRSESRDRNEPAAGGQHPKGPALKPCRPRCRRRRRSRATCARSRRAYSRSPRRPE